MLLNFISRRAWLSLLLLSAAMAGCGGGSPAAPAERAPDVSPSEPAPPAPPYQALLDAVVSESVPGAVLLVETPAKRFLGSAGFADLGTRTPMRTDAVMPVGSAGKPFIALLAAQLHQQGRLNLDDRLPKWLPQEWLRQIPNASHISLRQLLNHTSGIYNYTDTDDWIQAILAEPGQPRGDADILRFGLNKSAQAAPGSGFHYSNTGYLLVGLILDRVLGQHHSIALRERIIQPLALASMFYIGAEAQRGEFGAGYQAHQGALVNVAPLMKNLAVSDAPLASNATDLARAFRSLFKDAAPMNAELRRLMHGPDALVPVGDGGHYGLGIRMDRVRGQTVYSHAGLVYGFHTQSFYVPGKELSVVVLLNCSTRPVCSDALDRVTERVLEQAL